MTDISSPAPSNAPDSIAGAAPSSTVAVFARLFDDTTQLIVGFGWVTWSTVQWTSPTGPFQLSIGPTAPPAGASVTVASRNASAVFGRALPASLMSDPSGSTKLATVLTTNSTLSGNVVQAPALTHYVKP